MPKLQSKNRQKRGIPRTAPATSANGTTAAQVISPHVISHLLRTGSIHRPRNAKAIAKCPNASQSVPDAKKGKCRLVTANAPCTASSHATRPDSRAIPEFPSTARTIETSRSSGNAVSPLKTKPALNNAIQMRMRRINLAGSPVSNSREPLLPADITGHLHHNEQRHNTANGNRQAGKSLQKKCVGKKDKINQLRQARFQNRETRSR